MPEQIPETPPESGGIFPNLFPVPAFPRNQNGEPTYYPWGWLGRGHVVSDAATKRRLEKFLRQSDMISYGLIIIAAASGWKYIVPTIVVYGGWLMWGTGRITVACPIAERPQLKNFYAQSAAQVSRQRLWFSLTFLIVLVAICVATVMNAHSVLERLVIGLAALFFGACSLAAGYMLSIKCS